MLSIEVLYGKLVRPISQVILLSQVGYEGHNAGSGEILRLLIHSLCASLYMLNSGRSEGFAILSGKGLVEFDNGRLNYVAMLSYIFPEGRSISN